MLKGIQHIDLSNQNAPITFYVYIELLKKNLSNTFSTTSRSCLKQVVFRKIIIKNVVVLQILQVILQVLQV